MMETTERLTACIMNHVRDVLISLLEERAQNPYLFLGRFFKMLSITSSSGSVGPTSKTGVANAFRLLYLSTGPSCPAFSEAVYGAYVSLKARSGEVVEVDVRCLAFLLLSGITPELALRVIAPYFSSSSLLPFINMTHFHPGPGLDSGRGVGTDKLSHMPLLAFENLAGKAKKIERTASERFSFNQFRCCILACFALIEFEQVARKLWLGKRITGRDVAIETLVKAHHNAMSNSSTEDCYRNTAMNSDFPVDEVIAFFSSQREHSRPAVKLPHVSMVRQAISKHEITSEREYERAREYNNKPSVGSVYIKLGGTGSRQIPTKPKPGVLSYGSWCKVLWLACELSARNRANSESGSHNESKPVSMAID